MHFWIDKRSQTCGYSGRHRIPPSLQHANCGQQRRRRRRSRGKPMVTPVHRFQPIEGVHSGGRRLQQHQQQQQQHLNHQRQQLQHSYVPPSFVTHLGGAASAAAAGGRHNSAHSSELDSSVFLDIPLTTTINGELYGTQNPPPSLLPLGTLRCGIWTSFLLTCVFVVCTKFYFQSNGLEVMGFFALMTVIILLACCIMSLRRSTMRWDVLAASAPPPGPASTTSISHELDVTVHPEEGGSLRAMPVSPPPQPHLLAPPAPPPPTQPELPPPPYHIAILLPQQPPPPPLPPRAEMSDESPPPSYDKAVG